MKDERTIITYASVQKKLFREATRSIVGSASILIMGGIFFLMLYLIADSALPKPFAPLIVGIPAAILLIVCLFGGIKGLVQLLRAQGGNFTVLEDELRTMESNKFSLARFLLTFPNVFPTNTKAWHDHVFIFESGKTFVANSAEYQTTHLDTAAQVSSKGDSYITVFYNDAPDKIILLYSTKMFVYKE